MKYVWYMCYFAILALVAYFAFLYIKLKHFMNSYEYAIKISGFDTAHFGSLLNLGTNKSWVEVDLDIIINNPTDFSVTVKDLDISFFYDAFFVGNAVFDKEIELHERDVTTINTKCKIYMNKAALTMFGDIYAKQKTDIDYEISLKVEKMPIRIKYKDVYQYSTHKIEAIKTDK